MKKIVAVVAVLLSGIASGQEFPSRTVRIVVPFTPSGPTDVISRILAERLATKWRQPVIVENRPGAGTVIGSDIVAKAPPDGHTILMAVTAHAVNATLVKKLPYDTVKDFAPIVLIATAPNILAVNPAVPVKSIAELIAYLKANPGKLNAGSHGKGNMSHLAAEMLKATTGTDFTVIQYKGAQPAATALVAGEVNFMFDTGVVAPFVQSGKVRVIGTTGTRRATHFPDVPTLIESGLQDFEVISWYGYFTTAGTPRAALDVLNRGFNETLAEPDIRARILKLNQEPAGGTQEELDRIVKTQIIRWATVIKAAGIESD
ncbi:MAG: Bug family tripartite tricarboxylate transporter substrate binding protein [Burkholderiales bacterium]